MAQAVAHTNFTEFTESYEAAHKKCYREKVQGIRSYKNVYNMIYCNMLMKSHI